MKCNGKSPFGFQEKFTVQRIQNYPPFRFNALKRRSFCPSIACTRWLCCCFVSWSVIPTAVVNVNEMSSHRFLRRRRRKNSVCNYLILYKKTLKK
ncbi:unnamed protein product [Schistosoma curassoni]|nr:unnamed protein product [Schistosoma curassoni]